MEWYHSYVGCQFHDAIHRKLNTNKNLLKRQGMKNNDLVYGKSRSDPIHIVQNYPIFSDCKVNGSMPSMQFQTVIINYKAYCKYDRNCGKVWFTLAAILWLVITTHLAVKFKEWCEICENG